MLKRVDKNDFAYLLTITVQRYNKDTSFQFNAKAGFITCQLFVRKKKSLFNEV